MKKIICTMLACLSMAACNSSTPESMYSKKIDQTKKEQQRDHEEFARFVEQNPSIVQRNETANNNRLITGDEQRAIHDRVGSAINQDERGQAMSRANTSNRDRDNQLGYNTARNDWKLIGRVSIPKSGDASMFYDFKSLEKTNDTVKAWTTYIPVTRLQALLNNQPDKIIAEANDRKRNGYAPPLFNFKKGDEEAINNAILTETIASRLGTYSSELLEINCNEGTFRTLKIHDYKNGSLLKRHNTSVQWSDIPSDQLHVRTKQMLCS